jgi:hypothetical protein
MMGIDSIRSVLPPSPSAHTLTFSSCSVVYGPSISITSAGHTEHGTDYQGPSLFLLPPLFHQLYTDLGTTLAEHIDLLQCHPNYVIHYHDGEKVTLSSDRAQLRAEVEKWEGPGGGEKLDAFLAYALFCHRYSLNFIRGICRQEDR